MFLKKLLYLYLLIWRKLMDKVKEKIKKGFDLQIEI